MCPPTRASQRRLLRLNQRTHALFCQIQHSVHLAPGENCPFARHLHLNQTAVAKQDEIPIHARCTVFGIVEIQHCLPGIDTAGNSGNMADDRIRRNHPCLHQFVDGQTQRHPPPRDRCTAGSAVGLDNVAINGDLTLSQRRTVNAGTQGSSYKPLYFNSSAALPPGCSLAPVARVGGARQHAVFRRDPTQPGILQEWRRALFQRRSAQHVGAANLDQAGTLGMPHHAGFD